MDPKFQSSFIPKGPAAPSAAVFKTPPKKTSGGVIGFLAKFVFIISLLLAVGVYGYVFYLKSNIDKMGGELEMARAALDVESINEIVRLNNRIIGTEELLSKHTVLIPLFEFLEA